VANIGGGGGGWLEKLNMFMFEEVLNDLGGNRPCPSESGGVGRVGAVGWRLKGEEQMYWGEMLEGVQGKG